jgi:predicted acetyltransferase
MASQHYLKLIEPTMELADEYVAYTEEFRTVGEPFAWGQLAEFNGDVAALLDHLRDQEAGRDLKPGIVPQSAYWGVVDGRIVGQVRVRHRLNESTLKRGGHIGYEVRVSERGNGYATRMLALALERASERGIERALVTCNHDNPASARVIEKNGGMFEDEVEFGGVLNRRYWIDL